MMTLDINVLSLNYFHKEEGSYLFEPNNVRMPKRSVVHNLPLNILIDLRKQMGQNLSVSWPIEDT